MRSNDLLKRTVQLWSSDLFLTAHCEMQLPQPNTLVPVFKITKPEPKEYHSFSFTRYVKVSHVFGSRFNGLGCGWLPVLAQTWTRNR
jgi:hypothetical protein